MSARVHACYDEQGREVVWKRLGGAVELDRLRAWYDTLGDGDPPAACPVVRWQRAPVPGVVLDAYAGDLAARRAGEARLEDLELLGEVARCVARVHARGLRHGDLKPPNVLVDDLGAGEPGLGRPACLVDPALDEHGTLGWLPPWRPRDAPLDTNDDVFALGWLVVTVLLPVEPAPGPGEFVGARVLAHLRARWAPQLGEDGLVPLLGWLTRAHDGREPRGSTKASELVEIVAGLVGRLRARGSPAGAAEAGPVTVPPAAPPAVPLDDRADVPGASPALKRVAVLLALGSVSALLLLAVGAVSGGSTPAPPDGPTDEPSPAASPAVGLPTAEDLQSAGAWLREVVVPSGVDVPAARAALGAPTGQPGKTAEDDDEEPRVVVLAAYALGRTEVSQAEWSTWAPGPPPSERLESAGGLCREVGGLSLVGPELPVVCVSWLDAVAWLNARSVAEGLPPAYFRDEACTIPYDASAGRDDYVWWSLAANGYRLPTGDEWEWAARGGGRYALYPGVTSASQDAAPCAWSNVAPPGAAAAFGCEDAWPGLAPVDGADPTLAPPMEPWSEPSAPVWSQLGLGARGFHQLGGNVAEWVWQADGRHPDKAELRGGSWQGGPRDRVANRSFAAAHARSTVIGVRWARSAGGGPGTCVREGTPLPR